MLIEITTRSWLLKYIVYSENDFFYKHWKIEHVVIAYWYIACVKRCPTEFDPRQWTAGPTHVSEISTNISPCRHFVQCLVNTFVNKRTV